MLKDPKTISPVSNTKALCLQSNETAQTIGTLAL
jgi:hypothetical protein